jgi:hypothetical protein
MHFVLRMLPAYRKVVAPPSIRPRNILLQLAVGISLARCREPLKKEISGPEIPHGLYLRDLVAEECQDQTICFIFLLQLRRVVGGLELATKARMCPSCSARRGKQTADYQMWMCFD